MNINYEKISELYKKYRSQLLQIPNNQIIPFVYNIVDTVFKNLETPCKGSCSFCCHSKIFVTDLEVNYLEKVELSQEAKERQIKQRGDFNKLSFADKACIFLENGKCQVYETRPYICRKHYVALGTDPENCKQDEHGKTSINNEPYTIQTEIMIPFLIEKNNFKLKPLHEYKL